MKDELQKSLYERWPLIFQNHKNPSSALSWGICCGDGWFDLIDTLCAALQAETDLHGAPQAKALEVKEKFGCLRFAVGEVSERQREMCFCAESMSQGICEKCGDLASHGVMPNGGLIVTRCAKHGGANLMSLEERRKGRALL